jgi:A/G-specific adenine glycosylase
VFEIDFGFHNFTESSPGSFGCPVKITNLFLIPHFEYPALISWQEKNGRNHLPWRHLGDLDDAERAYRVWLSEIFLQQTQAERVIGFYDRVLGKFPTVQSLAATDYDTFFPFYQGLGYYSRARNLLACAKIVAGEYGGTFPTDPGKLRKLPGIGPYTAEAIRAFAYDIPTLSFDTNLEKVFSRYYLGSRFLKLDPAMKSEISGQFAESGYSARLINGAIMDFASLYSKNSKAGIDHAASPFRDCLFKGTLGELEIAAKKPNAYFPVKDSRLEVILHKDHAVYYSSSDAEYAPFFLPPTQDDIRKTVQAHFRDAYGLEVSVRPIHRKEYRDDAPFVSMYAQIQTGIPKFQTYSSTAGASEIGTSNPRIL